jgi:hypothetical protein
MNTTIFLILLLSFAAVICITAFIFYRLKLRIKIKTKDIKANSLNFYGQPKKRAISKVSTSIKLNDLNKDLEPFGFAYYPNQDIFYSIMDCWQRDCGYCELYDEAAPALCMIIDCEPIRFEFEGKKWLIEFWKGQYGMTTGCEIGIYTTKGPSLDIPGFFDGTFYSAASEEDHLSLSFELRKNGNYLFSRNAVHWWLTAFRLGEFSEPSELSMSVEITLKNVEMRNAFIDAFIEAGYSKGEYTYSNNTVRFVYETPHSPQAATRTPLTENLVQNYNERNCLAYQYATKNFYDPFDKMELVKLQAPKMYQKILNVGNTKELFSGYKKIHDFIGHEK